MNTIIEVPGNVSRLFKSSHEALIQKTARVDLVQDEGGGLIFNRLYDSSLISHDLNYCTSDSLHLLESMSVLEKLQRFIEALKEPKIVDIGCGQGEYVNELRAREILAYGFDPVLRSDSEYLYPKYFEQSDIAEFLNSSVIFTMRCVLPHINNPWEFLDLLLDSELGAPSRFAYIEYQQTEWIVGKGIWQQISHDHVNLFTYADFAQNYNVIETGEFAEGEWRWILVSKLNNQSPQKFDTKISISDINSLMEKREKDLDSISKLGYPLAIYGAAGKGAMLAHAISSTISGAEGLVAVDQDLNRVGHYLECSGVHVKPLAFLKDRDQEETRIIVANPNHLSWLKSEVRGAKFHFL
jgi:hypothetical protein